MVTPRTGKLSAALAAEADCSPLSETGTAGGRCYQAGLAPTRHAAGSSRPPHQPSRVQLRPGPGVTPGEVVVTDPMLVEMLHVPAQIDRPVKLQHSSNLRRLDALGRCLAQTTFDQPRISFLLKPVSVPPELPLRHSQQFPGLHHRQLPPFPAAQN